MSLPPIPDHLEHRPVVAGRVVPWVAQWDREKLTGRIVHDARFAAPLLDVTWQPDVGRPVWGLMHLDRQRACWVRGLCQICGPGTKADVLLQRRERTTFDGGEVDIWDEPGVCEPCAHYALSVCPGLLADPDPAPSWRPEEGRLLAVVVNPLLAPLQKGDQFDRAARRRIQRALDRYGALIGAFRLVTPASAHRPWPGVAHADQVAG